MIGSCDSSSEFASIRWCDSVHVCFVCVHVHCTCRTCVSYVCVCLCNEFCVKMVWRKYGTHRVVCLFSTYYELYNEWPFVGTLCTLLWVVCVVLRSYVIIFICTNTCGLHVYASVCLSVCLMHKYVTWLPFFLNHLVQWCTRSQPTEEMFQKRMAPTSHTHTQQPQTHAQPTHKLARFISTKSPKMYWEFVASTILLHFYLNCWCNQKCYANPPAIGKLPIFIVVLFFELLIC